METAKLLYTYSFDTGTLAAGATATDSVAIEADSSFVITKGSYFATDDAGTAQTYNSRIVPLVLMQLRDTGSGREFFDEAQPIPNLFGSGEIPFIFPVQQVVRANSVLRANFTSLEATNTVRIWISLIGYKLYNYGD